MVKLLIAVSMLLLVGCATKDPTLAYFVERKGQGIYKSKTIGFVDGLDQAIKQCQIDGDKKLDIITTTTEYSYSSRKNLTIYLFRCVEK